MASLLQRSLALSLLRRAGASSLNFSGSPTSRNELYDMVIVGGGMVGSALASSIGVEPSLAHKQVLLLEASRSAPRRVAPEDAYSNRVSAISRGSVQLLTKVNAWSRVKNMRPHPFDNMHVWDACSDAAIVFNRSSLQGDTAIFDSPPDTPLDGDIITHSYHGDTGVMDESLMGYIVENRALLSALSEVLEECSNVTVQREAKIQEIRGPESQATASPSPWAELELQTGETIRTRLLIGADGSNSRVRKMCGFSQVGWNYDQSAVVATVDIQETDRNATAWQRFLPSGPIAMLPLSPSVSSITWTTSPSHAKSLTDMNEEKFVDAVNAAFTDPYPQNDFVSTVNEAVRDTLAMLTTDPPPPRQSPPVVCGVDAGSRAQFPLAIGHSPHYVKPRIALVGDAAHRIHPMAGLGVNLGFGDVAALTSSLLLANGRGADWGSLSHLLEYETARQLHNVPTMAAVDGLHSLFSTAWAPAVLLRTLGLQLTNAATPIKDYIIEHAQRVA